MKYILNVYLDFIVLLGENTHKIVSYIVNGIIFGFIGSIIIGLSYKFTNEPFTISNFLFIWFFIIILSLVSYLIYEHK